MLVTEAEAKTKWCPFVRVPSVVEGSGSINRGPDQQTLRPEVPATVAKKSLLQDRCLASDCMMWQSEPSAGMMSVQARRRGTEGWETWGWDPRRMGNAEQYPEWDFRDRPPEKRGSCGLAK